MTTACRDSVIVKLPAQSEAGLAMKMLGGYAREVAFYRQIAGRAPLGTPRVYAARMAENAADFVLVLEDTCRGGTTPIISQGCRSSAPGGVLAAAELAGLHAWSPRGGRNAARLEAFSSIDTPR